jgi:hypothetical protein
VENNARAERRILQHQVRSVRSLSNACCKTSDCSTRLEWRPATQSGHAASTLFKFACAGPRLIDAYALFRMRNPPIVIPLTRRFCLLQKRQNEFVLVAMLRTFGTLHQWLQTLSPAAYPAWSDGVEGSLCAGSSRARFSARHRRTSRSTSERLLCHIF